MKSEYLQITISFQFGQQHDFECFFFNNNYVSMGQERKKKNSPPNLNKAVCCWILLTEVCMFQQSNRLK